MNSLLSVTQNPKDHIHHLQNLKKCFILTIFSFYFTSICIKYQYTTIILLYLKGKYFSTPPLVTADNSISVTLTLNLLLFLTQCGR